MKIKLSVQSPAANQLHPDVDDLLHEEHVHFCSHDCCHEECEGGEPQRLYDCIYGIVSISLVYSVSSPVYSIYIRALIIKKIIEN